MTILLHKPYLVKVETLGGGGQNSEEKWQRGLCMAPKGTFIYHEERFYASFVLASFIGSFFTLLNVLHNKKCGLLATPLSMSTWFMIDQFYSI